MANYIIGDIQGCFKTLTTLLDKLHFLPAKDSLWLLGDLVNRGRYSLETLRFLSELPYCDSVLGNHDLHLLGVDAKVRQLRKDDTLDAILAAPDKRKLLAWLVRRPLYLTIPKTSFFLIHGGIPPQTDFAHLTETLDEFHQGLAQETRKHLADLFSTEKTSTAEVANTVTRIRFCLPDQTVFPEFKGSLAAGEERGLIPWYQCLHPSWQNKKIVFGHWAALGGQLHTDRLLALDTGCVWGKSLSAYCVEEDSIVSVEANTDDLYKRL